jgi:hypothetical protein
MEKTIPLVDVVSKTETETAYGSDILDIFDVPRRALEILEGMSSSSSDYNDDYVCNDERETNYEDSGVGLINLPDIQLMSSHHSLSRVEYLKEKKWPQIRWLLQKLQQVLVNLDVDGDSSSSSSRVYRLLDVGGGRGDLAVAMAQGFSNVHVTVVDINESSLKAGKAYAERILGTDDADNRVDFHCANFANFVQDELHQNVQLDNVDDGEDHKRFDVVIAWHACGDLSDYALEFAVRINASFVICPCCYTKRYIHGFEPRWIGDYLQSRHGAVTNGGTYCHDVTLSTERTPYTETHENDVSTLQRIAEINDRPEVSRRAMLLINSMRLRSLGRQEQQMQQHQHQQQQQAASSNNEFSTSWKGHSLCLEEYGIEHSKKNLVLVGMIKS